MSVTTGLSGHEIYCLQQKGYAPGNIVIGNSVHALGFLGSLGSGVKSILGGEIRAITEFIAEGRETAYTRMRLDAETNNAHGISGVNTQLISHGSNIEFLSVGSALHALKNPPEKLFSTSATGQELYAQMDAGFQALGFAFGNTAYTMGLRRGLSGGIKTLGRGEIKEYSDVFNQTRHLALQALINNAKQQGADAVLGIKTSIIPFGSIHEMLMIGTASKKNTATATESDKIITSGMSNIELWSMTNLGYEPLQLLLGTSVYSLGLVGGVRSSLKSFVRGEINELTQLIYAARENALAIINEEAEAIGADDILGVKTYIYPLGNGLIEFLAIGTAVKRVTGSKTQSEQLPPQAIAINQDSFYDAYLDAKTGINVNLNSGTQTPFARLIFPLLFLFIMIILSHLNH